MTLGALAVDEGMNGAMLTNDDMLEGDSECVRLLASLIGENMGMKAGTPGEVHMLVDAGLSCEAWSEFGEALMPIAALISSATLSGAEIDENDLLLTP